MTRLSVSCLTALLAVVAIVAAPADVFAQAAGAGGPEDFQAGDDELPGEASTAPPTSEAADGPTEVHPGDESTPAPVRDHQLEAGDQSATVRVVHGADEEADLAGLPVILEAVQPPGPLQPDNFEQTVSSWDATTDEQGRAHFEDLPDDLDRQGLALRASTHFGGLAFESQRFRPDARRDVELPVYDQTHDFPGVRLTEKRVLVSPYEEYMIIDQFWTLQLEGDRAFDTTASPAFEDGLPLELPYTAEGISAQGPGDHDIVENVVYYNGVLQPDRPTTIQIRFSMSVRTSEFTFEHEMDYPVEDLDVLAAVDTDFEKHPRLDDLVLRAPNFEVGDDPTEAGLPPHTTRDFLVATDHSLEAGDSYAFRLEGLPFGRPLGAWIALIGGILAALFVAAWGRREYVQMRNARNDAGAVQALRRRRDELLDELAGVERQIEQLDGADDELLFELEEQRMLLRQRLQLIMRKIDDIESGDDSQAADAA